MSIKIITKCINHIPNMGVLMFSSVYAFTIDVVEDIRYPGLGRVGGGEDEDPDVALFRSSLLFILCCFLAS